MEEYSSRISSFENEKLSTLESFFWTELPAKILERRNEGPCLTKDELKKVVEWKLTRGKWRPRLLTFASSLEDADVINASKNAFAALPDLKSAVNAFCTLKGVGPATASALLTAFDSHVPFMSDEALEASTGSREYTLKHYLGFAKLLKDKAADLNSRGGKGEEGEKFTASDIEKALWVSRVQTKPPKKKVSAKKESARKENSKKESDKKGKYKSKRGASKEEAEDEEGTNSEENSPPKKTARKKR